MGDGGGSGGDSPATPSKLGEGGGGAKNRRLSNAVTEKILSATREPSDAVPA